MKVLFDSQIFDLQKYGGISRYFSELYNGLLNNSEVLPILSVKESENIHFNQMILQSGTNPSLISNFYKRVQYRFFPELMPKNINRSYTIELLKQNAFDICHATYYDPYFLEHIKKPYVITVYDMIYELFQDDFNTAEDEMIRNNKRRTIAESSAIITISQSTKNDLLNYYDIDERKVNVIYLASSFLNETETGKTTEGKSNYILFVGNRGKYKNFVFCLQSIHNLLLSNKSLKLICAGPKFSIDEQKLFKEMNIEDQLLHRFPSENELPNLYKNALMFIFPSLYEGFGLPILEAFGCKCPVACSNTSSFQEVAGEGALKFDPYSNESISSAVQQILENKELRGNLISKGSEQLKKFSWENTVQETKEVYKKIVDANVSSKV